MARPGGDQRYLEPQDGEKERCGYYWPYHTAGELAKELDVSYRTVIRWIKIGKIMAEKGAVSPAWADETHLRWLIAQEEYDRIMHSPDFFFIAPGRPRGCNLPGRKNLILVCCCGVQEVLPLVSDRLPVPVASKVFKFIRLDGTEGVYKCPNCGAEVRSGKRPVGRPRKPRRPVGRPRKPRLAPPVEGKI